jgi:hypothetical protein
MQATEGIQAESFFMVGQSLLDSHYAIPFPISKEQMRRIYRYMEDCGKYERVICFYRENGDSRLKLRVEVLKGACVGGLVGGGMGAFVSYLAKTAVAKSVRLVLPPPVASALTVAEGCSYLYAAGVGMVSGALVGVAVSATLTISRDVETDTYLEWRAQAIRTNVYPLFQQTIADEKLELREFLCPLTVSLVTFPCRTKNGQLFEKDALVALIQLNKEEGRPTVYEGETIEEKDLVYDPFYHPRLFQRLQQLLDEKVDSYKNTLLSSYSEAIREGLMKFKDSIRESSIEILKKMVMVYRELNHKGQIDFDRYHRLQGELIEHYHLFG